MTTTNYNLPTITGNMTADVVRDMNALAVATDSAIKEESDNLASVTQRVGTVEQRLTTHLSDSSHWMQFNRNLNQSIANETDTIVLCNEEQHFNGANFAKLGGDGRVYIKEKGLYLISAYVVMAMNEVGYRRLTSTYIADVRNAFAGGETTLAATSIAQYNVDDLVTFSVFQNCGSPLNITNAVFRLSKVGDVV